MKTRCLNTIVFVIALILFSFLGFLFSGQVRSAESCLSVDKVVELEKRMGAYIGHRVLTTYQLNGLIAKIKGNGGTIEGEWNTGMLVAERQGALILLMGNDGLMCVAGLVPEELYDDVTAILKSQGV